jgi:hypothetical protein
MGINYRVQDPNRQWQTELLASGKHLYCEVPCEGSQTAKSCTDEQEPHTKAGVCMDEVARHTEVQICRTTGYVDAAAIG